MDQRMDQREVAARQIIRRFMDEHPGLRVLDGADIPCSECGQTYPDDYWAHVYGDPWEMPELGEFVCDRCRFGGDESADELPEDSLVTSWQEAENEAVASGELGGDEWEDEPLHYEPGWVPHMAPERPDSDDDA